MTITTKPIIPWMGGKRRLAKRIIELMPAHTCYVEPFAGGAAVFFDKQPSKVEVLNDINGELVNLYRVVQHHLEEFVRQFKWALSSRRVFEWQKMTRPETLTDIQRAARFYYLQKLCFGAKVAGQTYGTATTHPPRLNLLRMEEDLSAAHLRLERVNIEHLPWLDVMKKYDRPHTVFYLDPPYWQTAGYGTEFGLEQYEAMADFAKTCKGKVIISLGDHPDMRQVFDGFVTDVIPLRHTVGGGKGKMVGELVIRSF